MGWALRICLTWSSEQADFGCVPLVKISFLILGQAGQARVLVRGQMATLTRLLGVTKGGGGLCANRVVKVWAQMGEAPVMPEAMELMGELSLLPTQTATNRLGV